MDGDQSNCMNTPRFLTKSRFKLATSCPAKLYYTKNDAYPDRTINDSFLLALARGGFQVGELAKCYFPGGIEVETLDYEEALRQTNALLAADNVIIYEAAIAFENYFIRVDVLVKSGDHFDVIEVKSKSVDSTDISFRNKNGTIMAGWMPYLYDIAFQKHVVQIAYPKKSVAGYLMLVDRSANCPTDGLNQKFRVRKGPDGRRRAAIAVPVSEEDLKPPILCKVNVDDLCDQIYSSADGQDDAGRSFTERATLYADYYARDEQIPTPLHQGCKKCEFHASAEEIGMGLRSGFRECWSTQRGWGDSDFVEPLVFDVWNYHAKRLESRFAENRLKISELVEDDISPKPDGRPGVSQSERQWIQVKKAINKDSSAWVDKDGLEKEMRSWKFPLHFIDFETSMAAIPFNKGRRPYEGIAFQFSHHVVYEDGRIAHQGEYLNAEPGHFPNYDFVRALKRELEIDGGSIFRYADHENSYLNMVYRQMFNDPDHVADRKELAAFIRSITKSPKDSAEQWEGPRNMVDMCRLVKRYHYDPFTKGSNSIKKVLPALLNSSEFLKDKYSQPIYGSPHGISSKNFQNWKWIQFKDGNVIDPYTLLPKLFQDISDHDLELISDEDELNEGGAAMTAYARLQFEDMSEYERSEIESALLKYCELDTFAMVMIYEGWKELISNP